MQIDDDLADALAEAAEKYLAICVALEHNGVSFLEVAAIKQFISDVDERRRAKPAS